MSGSPFSPVLLFFDGDPYLAGIIGILNVRRRINLKLHAAPVFVSGILREEFGADPAVDLSESVGHSAAAHEHRIGMRVNLNDIEAVFGDFCAVVLRAYAVRKSVVRHLPRKAYSENSVKSAKVGVFAHLFDGAVLGALSPESGDIVRRKVSLRLLDTLSPANHLECIRFFNSVIHNVSALQYKLYGKPGKGFDVSAASRLARADAVESGKRSREALGSIVSAPKRNVDDPVVGAVQLVRRDRQTAHPYIISERVSAHHDEHPLKMKRRRCGLARDRAVVRRFVKMRFNIVYRPLNSRHPIHLPSPSV